MLATSVAAGLAGLAAGPLIAGLLAAIGAGVSLTGLPLAVSVVLGGLWAAVPWVSVRSEARTRRRDVVHGLSAFMDLVALSVAAGRGVETALDRAAASGQGPAFDAIRATLGRSRNVGESVWTGLSRLGEEMGTHAEKSIGSDTTFLNYRVRHMTHPRLDMVLAEAIGASIHCRTAMSWFTVQSLLSIGL